MSEDCVLGTRNETRVDNLESRADKVDMIIEKIRNRLPVWATLFIAGLTGIIGWLVK